MLLCTACPTVKIPASCCRHVLVQKNSIPELSITPVKVKYLDSVHNVQLPCITDRKVVFLSKQQRLHSPNILSEPFVLLRHRLCFINAYTCHLQPHSSTSSQVFIACSMSLHGSFPVTPDYTKSSSMPHSLVSTHVLLSTQPAKLQFRKGVVVIVEFTCTITRNGGGEVYVRLMHLSNVGPTSTPSLPGKGDGKSLLSNILIQCQHE